MAGHMSLQGRRGDWRQRNRPNEAMSSDYAVANRSYGLYGLIYRLHASRGNKARRFHLPGTCVPIKKGGIGLNDPILE